MIILCVQRGSTALMLALNKIRRMIRLLKNCDVVS